MNNGNGKDEQEVSDTVDNGYDCCSEREMPKSDKVVRA
jgi:hypothetical protein